MTLQNQRGGAKRFAISQQQPVAKKRIENLARTGNEYPLMKIPHHFIP